MVNSNVKEHPRWPRQLRGYDNQIGWKTWLLLLTNFILLPNKENDRNIIYFQLLHMQIFPGYAENAHIPFCSVYLMIYGS